MALSLEQMNTVSVMYETIIGSNKLMNALDAVQDVINFSDGQNEKYKRQMERTHAQIIQANDLLAELLGVLGSLSGAWSSVKNQIVNMDEEMSPQEIKTTLSLDGILCKIRNADQVLSVNVAESIAFYRHQLGELDHSSGLEAAERDVAHKLDSDIGALEQEHVEISGNLMNKKLERARLLGDLELQTELKSVLATGIKDEETRKQALTKLNQELYEARALSQCADRKSVTSIFSRRSLGVTKDLAERQEIVALHKIEELKAAFPTYDSAAAKVKIAEIWGKVKQMQATHNILIAEIEEIEQRLSAQHHSILMKQTELRKLDKAVKDKLVATGTVSLEMYTKLVGAVRHMSRQNDGNNQGYRAFGAMIAKSIEHYHTQVEKFAGLPVTKQRALLQSQIRQNGCPEWSAFAPELCYASMYMATLVKVMVDPKAADGMQLKDIIAPSLQMLTDIAERSKVQALTVLPSPQIALPPAPVQLAVTTPSAPVPSAFAPNVPALSAPALNAPDLGATAPSMSEEDLMEAMNF